MEAIAVISKARAALVAAKSLDDVKSIRDKAEACRQYAKTAGESLAMQNECAEVKLLAERRAGELLAKMEKDKGGARTGNTMLPVLADLGITKMQSSRWQAVASIPARRFEEHIVSVKNRNAELTTAGVIKIAKQIKAQLPARATIDDAAVVTNELPACGSYRCIYADPPWSYGNQATRAATDNHYQTIATEDICRLPVAKSAANDAHLWMWTTNGFLQESFAVMAAWGFTYKSVMVWVKPQLGIGNYLRVSHEFLMFATRGKLPVRDKSIRSWIEHDRLQHSRKPEVFRQVIEKASDGPYLELFARNTSPGWTAWGNQVQRGLYG